jgi:hypothetical protein
VAEDKVQLLNFAQDKSIYQHLTRDKDCAQAIFVVPATIFCMSYEGVLG